MNLWQSFTRKTAAATPWTIDALPVDASGAQVAPGASLDCAIAITQRDNIGWPAHRMIIAYHGPTSAATLTGTLYAWDTNSQRYYIVAAAFNLVPETLNFVSIVSVANPPTRSGNMDQALAGGTSFILVVTPTAATTNGSYVFSMAPDLVQQ